MCPCLVSASNKYGSSDYVEASWIDRGEGGGDVCVNMCCVHYNCLQYYGYYTTIFVCVCVRVCVHVCIYAWSEYGNGHVCLFTLCNSLQLP